ncbi:hypothetical protein CC2G_011484 [Coprinopsis cinerea AmutBmut pab1-1]|nr:hypothetical protein CC2G_011484 [Coprinopsis cinerea AmutBmut pab1-1]
MAATRPTNRVRVVATAPTALERPPRLPTELVDLIVETYINICRSKYSNNVYFQDVWALTLVSNGVRWITFRHFLANIVITSPVHWDRTLVLLKNLSITYSTTFPSPGGGEIWVRSLSIHTTTLFPNRLELRLFSNLHILSLDFRHEGLNTQKQTVLHLFGALGQTNSTSVLHPNAHVAGELPVARYGHPICDNLQVLHLTKLASIDVNVLNAIVGAFPRLKELYLESTSRLKLTCCPNCYDESLTLTTHSPIPRIIPTVEILSATFGSILEKLKNLRILQLGIFLSPEEYVENHLDHVPDWTDGLWRPETMMSCASCQLSSESIRRNELLATFGLAQYVKTLETISWSSCCGFPEGSTSSRMSLKGRDVAPDAGCGLVYSVPRSDDDGQEQDGPQDTAAPTGDGDVAANLPRNSLCVTMNIVRKDGTIQIQAL